MDAIITSDQVLAMTKQMLRLSSTTDNDIYLTSLVVEGVRRLSTNETLIIKNCTVQTTNSRFYLPKDCKNLVAFRFSNSCIQGVFVDIPFFTQCGCSSTSLSGFGTLVGMLNVVGRWAYLIMAVDDNTEVEIAYLAVNTDENGMPIINEEMEIAVSNYAAWKFAVSYPELYNRVQIMEWKEEYMLQAARCRGLAARRKFEQDREQISSKITQIVNTNVPFNFLAGSYYSFYYPTIR